MPKPIKNKEKHAEYVKSVQDATRGKSGRDKDRAKLQQLCVNSRAAVQRVMDEIDDFEASIDEFLDA